MLVVHFVYKKENELQGLVWVYLLNLVDYFIGNTSRFILSNLVFCFRNTVRCLFVFVWYVLT